MTARRVRLFWWPALQAAGLRVESGGGADEWAGRPGMLIRGLNP
jgi:hypothetical protein